MLTGIITALPAGYPYFETLWLLRALGAGPFHPH
jgi:hypothetical protein